MQQSRTKLFLIELIIIMLFFAFAGAACMNLFANAKNLSTSSTQLTQAYLKAQDTAEVLKSQKSAQGAIELLKGVPTSDGFEIYYDESWQQQAQEGKYKLKAQLATNNDMLSANISVYNVYNKEELIYNITAKIFVSERELK